MYKALVIKYAAKAKEMAAQVEEAANAMEREGYRLVSFTAMPSAKGVLVFHREREAPMEKGE